MKDAHSIKHPDPSLLFINASITPYKQQIIDSLNIHPFGVLQPCFRFRKCSGYMYHFNMMGLIGEINSSRLLINSLLNFLHSIGIPSCELGVVYRNNHLSLLKEFFDPLDNIIQLALDSDSNKFATDWTFGDDRITGKGLTIVRFTNPLIEDFNDSSVIPLGNIIYITNSKNRHYIDIGFGIETIESTFFNNSIFTIPEHHITSEKFENLDAELKRIITTNVFAIIFLFQHGVAFSNRGQGYILKKCFYDMFKYIIDDSKIDEIQFRSLVSELFLNLKINRSSEKKMIENITNDFLKNQLTNFNKIKILISKDIDICWDKIRLEKGITKKHFERLESFYGK